MAILLFVEFLPEWERSNDGRLIWEDPGPKGKQILVDDALDGHQAVEQFVEKRVEALSLSGKLSGLLDDPLPYGLLKVQEYDPKWIGFQNLALPMRVPGDFRTIVVRCVYSMYKYKTSWTCSIENLTLSGVGESPLVAHQNMEAMLRRYIITTLFEKHGLDYILNGHHECFTANEVTDEELKGTRILFPVWIDDIPDESSTTEPKWMEREPDVEGSPI